MIEVADGIWVGSKYDEEMMGDRFGWSIVHCCKTYHQAMLGYTTRAAPLGPERLVAIRGNELFLNMIDAPDKDYLPVELFDAARGFIYDARSRGERVLLHCDQGHSRAPGVAMYYMMGMLPDDFGEALAVFTELYPPTMLGAGVSGRLKAEWDLATQ